MSELSVWRDPAEQVNALIEVLLAQLRCTGAMDRPKVITALHHLYLVQDQLLALEDERLCL